MSIQIFDNCNPVPIFFTITKTITNKLPEHFYKKNIPLNTIKSYNNKECTINK